MTARSTGRYSGRSTGRYCSADQRPQTTDHRQETTEVEMAGSALGFMAEPVSNRRSADARVGDDLDLTIHEGEAR